MKSAENQPHKLGNTGKSAVQESAWEREYRKPQLLSKANEPQADMVRFYKFYRKTLKQEMEGKHVLDLGSGTGRNAYYFAEQGAASVLGLEISDTAIRLAEQRSEAAGFGKILTYKKQDMGKPFALADESIDLAIDITSSNSLDEKGRASYLRETYRVLKPGGIFFVKALCKDGDDNAKTLLKKSPGKEYDTYYMKELDLYERVFSREDFVKMYTGFMTPTAGMTEVAGVTEKTDSRQKTGFKILHIEKKTSYPKVDGRMYKRNHLIVYMQK